MKKVLDKDIANNIIDLNIYINEWNNVLIILPLIENLFVYSLTTFFLETFKLNRGLSLYTIPYYF